MYSLSALNAYSHLSSHKNLLLSFNESKKEMHLSVALEMNLLRVATLSIRLCTSLVLLRDRISIRAYIFSGLASMPRWLTINPRNLFGGHAEYTLEGVQLHAIRPEDIERIDHVGDVVRCYFRLDEHVVYVNLHCLTNLFLEHHIN